MFASKSGLKESRAVPYAGWPGRISLPFSFAPSALQSAEEIRSAAASSSSPASVAQPVIAVARPAPAHVRNERREKPLRAMEPMYATDLPAK